MEKLKTLTAALSLVALLIAFNACKKGGSGSEPEQSINWTDYYIAGKVVFQPGTNVPYVITFKPNAQAVIQWGDGSENANYTFQNGSLKLDLGGGGDVFNFKIEGEAITDLTTQGETELASYTLEKVPAQNALAGAVYSGSFRTAGSPLMVLSKLKFTENKYGESTLNEPVPNKDYTPIQHVAGTGVSGSNGTITFFVLIAGKLEAARYTHDVNGLKTIATGTFTKQ
ncbi:hypothetical protein C7T94_16275 [Pedobacter yulinensis]|uniref:Lipocalin-like domain-containing protein n=1 Tax=Pedobacter yulinensis TaxID=2126353 RepID=A0A2T3HIR5_9SPHI|nr:hypothetical protein [Pedobacter yulinensis]PST82336.1 hypothetical protein C7T94_16275 [Pedobacter yulinensis]